MQEFGGEHLNPVMIDKCSMCVTGELIMHLPRPPPAIVNKSLALTLECRPLSYKKKFLKEAQAETFFF